MAKPKKNKSTMVEQTAPKTRKGVNLGKLIGILLISIGGFLLFLALFSWILSFFPPFIQDNSLPIPSLNPLPSYTKETSLVVVGSVDPSVHVVYMYVNGDWVRTPVAVDKSGTFSFIYKAEKEGSYEFEAISASGALLRRRSEKSNKVKTVVDWTSPSVENVSLIYPKELKAKDSFDLVGTVDPNINVLVVNETSNKKFYGRSDEEGRFKIESLRLVSGENVLTVYLEDLAGNKVTLPKKIRVTYSGKDNLNNVSGYMGKSGQSNLPESAGNISEAVTALLANRVSVFLGIMTWIMLLFALKFNRKLSE